MPKCPHCSREIEIRLTAAPSMQADKNKRGLLKREADDVGEYLESVNVDSLNAWEKEFIGGLRERYEEWGDRIKLTDKQWYHLRKIATGEE